MAGGLGNQMFQYAAGLALALRHRVPLRFDRWTDKKRQLELPRVFGLDLPGASQSEMRQVLGWCEPSMVRRVMARPLFRSLRPASWVIEPHFHYWSGFEAVGSVAYLDGYWQSARALQSRHITSEYSYFRRQKQAELNNGHLEETPFQHWSGC
jgi:hypothetical protein